MMRPLVLVVAATMLVGCQTPTALVDPFLGRQTVPPPSTGMATNTPPPDSSYYNAPKSSSAGAANGTSTASPYAPPGGYGYADRGFTNRSGSNAPINRTAAPLSSPASLREGSSPRPSAGSTPMRATGPAERPPQGTPGASSRGSPAGGSFTANSNPPMRVVKPTRTVSARGDSRTISRTPVSGAPLSPTRRPNSGAQRPTDIMNLPEANPAAAPATEPRSNASSGFRPVGGIRRASYEEPQAAGNDRSSPAPGFDTVPDMTPGQFSHDGNYTRLSGRLEYSRSDDRWKLRYIPIDGDTDDYGGSVVLLGARDLDEFKPGEYVTVQGRIEKSASDSRGFAPSYRVEQVERQTQARTK